MRILYTATWAWWEIVSIQREEIQVSDYQPDHAHEAAKLAGIVYTDQNHESWVAPIVYVHPVHTHLEIGDLVCCNGYGNDVTFIRP